MRPFICVISNMINMKTLTKDKMQIIFNLCDTKNIYDIIFITYMFENLSYISYGIHQLYKK